MRRGDNAYIIESSRIIRPVRILNCAGGLYLIKFLDSEGAIRVHPDRLYNTREAAEEQVKQRPIKAPDWHYMSKNVTRNRLQFILFTRIV